MTMPTTGTRQLKQVSIQFRSLVSRALRSTNDDARVNLRRLLTFVDATPLLRAEIDRAPKPSVDVAEFWEKAQQQRRIDFPDDPLEELGLLHALLNEFARPSDDSLWSLCYPLCGSSNFNECVQKVMHDTCGRYGGHLGEVIELALLDSDDPAYDGRHIEVHVSGGNNQLNVAQDQSRIDARQAVGATGAEIFELARELATLASEAARTTSCDQALELEDVSNAVLSTVESQHPNRFTLRMAKERLEVLANTVSIVSALAPYAHQLVPRAQTLAALVGQWLAALPHG